MSRTGTPPVTSRVARRCPPGLCRWHLLDGLTLAEDAHALGDLPGFDTSAMDGWAVSGSGPWSVVGEVLAGYAPTLDLDDGQACVIATGAAVPAGATGIVRRERGQVEAGQLRGDHEPGEDIRPAGEECRAGEVLLGAGSEIGPAAIGLLSAAGLDEVLVHPRPKAWIVLFGDELVDAGVAGVGQVRDALGPQLPGWLRRIGVEVVAVSRAADTLGEHVERIQEAAEGVRCRDHDRRHGGRPGRPPPHRGCRARWGVRGGQRGGAPGAPHGAGRSGHRRLLALPGNPQSAIVALLSLGVPLFESLSGRTAQPLPEVRLGEAAKAPATEHRLLASRLVDGVAVPVAHLGSAMLRGLAAADGFAVLPPGGSDAGDDVAWLSLP